MRIFEGDGESSSQFCIKNTPFADAKRLKGAVPTEGGRFASMAIIRE